MKFTFDMRNAAGGNTASARIREQTRMASLAYGLHLLGHDVRIVSCTEEFRASARFPVFSHLTGDDHGGLRVCPSDDRAPCDVLVKCSVGSRFDGAVLDRCRLLVAHEYDVKLEHHPKLLRVPFLLHDSVNEHFVQTGLMRAYLEDDLGVIRSHFAATKVGVLGYSGYCYKHRREVCAGAPEWADIRFYENPRMTAAEHIRWIMGFRAGLAIPGDTPKTYTHSLLAMLGIPIVSPTLRTTNEVPLTDANHIRLEGWGRVLELVESGEADERARAMDESYKAGWSPLGQARLIAERLA